MSSPAKKPTKEPNIFLEYPGVVACVFAVGVVAIFLGALLGPVYLGNGEHNEHGAEPAADHK